MNLKLLNSTRHVGNVFGLLNHATKIQNNIRGSGLIDCDIQMNNII